MDLSLNLTATSLKCACRMYAFTPERYKLFQVADMIATLKLVELKIEHGEQMTESEFKFFGGIRNFKRNYLRFVKAKEI